MIKTQFEYRGQIIRCELSEAWTQNNWNVRIYDANGVGNLYSWGKSKRTGNWYKAPKPYYGNTIVLEDELVLLAYKKLKAIAFEGRDAAAMTVLKPRQEEQMQPRVEEQKPMLQPRTRTASGTTDRF